MFKRIIDWYRKQASVYPARWYFPVIRIYGGPAGGDSGKCYLTRILLSPVIRNRQVYLHIFHREDLDRDPHDHPFDFWTFPLNQGYLEDVFDPQRKCFRKQWVKQWRWSFRPATHTHRVLNTETGLWPLVTLVVRGKHQRPWGFWCHSPRQLQNDPTRFWCRWQNYMKSGGGEVLQPNIPGRDDACPGAGG
jgi:hypothetical protein